MMEEQWLWMMVLKTGMVELDFLLLFLFIALDDHVWRLLVVLQHVLDYLNILTQRLVVILE